MAGEEKLTLKSEAKGFDETAKQVDKVTDAQDRLKDTVKGTAEPTRETADAQAKLNTSEAEFVDVLTRLSPRVGGWVDGMLRATKVAGDLSEQQVKLGSVTQTVTGLISANAGALKLLLAGGAVVGGIVAITKAMGAMRAESAALVKQLQKQKEAQDALRTEHLDRQQQIEKLSDTRREGGFTADESRRGQTVANRANEKFDFLDKDSVNRAVAFGGVDRSAEEVARIAFLVQSQTLELDPQRSQESQDRLIERRLRQFSDRIEKAFARERAQGQIPGAAGERGAFARGQAKGDPGSSAIDLEKIAQQFVDTKEDAEEIVRIIQEAGGTLRGLENLAQGGQLAGQVTPDGIKLVEKLTEAQRSTARQVIVTIKNTFHNQHSKNVGPSARSQRGDILNGEKMSRSRGER